MIKKDLFEFHYGDKSWFFTSSKKPITHNGNTYLPNVLNRTDIDDEDIDKCSVDIRFPFPNELLNDDGDDLQSLFLNKIYFTGVTCTILELYQGDTLVIFQGRVISPDFNAQSRIMTLKCSTAETYQRRNILTRKFQRTCPNKIYDRFCGLDFEAWSVECTVTAISGNAITVSASNPLESLYYNRGILLKDNIYTFILTNLSNTLTLYRPHFGLDIGDTVKIAPGCDQSHKTCKDKFSNHMRFMGHLYIPQTNPVNDQIIR